MPDMTYPGDQQPIIPPHHPGWQPQQPLYIPPPKKHTLRTVLLLAVAGLVTLVGVGAVIAAATSDGKKPTASHQVLPSSTAQHIKPGEEDPGIAPATPPVVLPKVTDFSLAVKVLRKACFGSAGCNITYRIDPTYNGAPFPAGVKFEVIYQVNGGEDGPQINRFTIGAGDGPGNSWQASVQEEELISTKSSSAALTAVVTDVSQA